MLVTTMHQPHLKRKPSLSDPFIVYTVLASDVLCGRDSNSTQHVGNRRFRSLVQSYCERYQLAQKRSEKTQITREVINIIHGDGGRFLRFDEKLGCWVQVEKMAYIHDKVSHALRSSKVPIPKSVSKDQEGVSKIIKGEEEQEDDAFQELITIQGHIYQDLLKKHCRTMNCDNKNFQSG